MLQKVSIRVGQAQTKFTRFSLHRFTKLWNYFFQKKKHWAIKVIGITTMLTLLTGYWFCLVFIAFFSTIAQTLRMLVWGKATDLSIRPLPAEKIIEEKIVTEYLPAPEQDTSPIVREEIVKYIPQEEIISEEEKELIELMSIPKDHSNLMLSYQRHLEVDLKYKWEELEKKEEKLKKYEDGLENLRQLLEIRADKLNLGEEKVKLMEMQIKNDTVEEIDPLHEEKITTERLKQSKLREEIKNKRIEGGRNEFNAWDY